MQVNKLARILSLGAAFVAFASSVIVFGITVWFWQHMDEYNTATTHVIYQAIVAGCSMVLYLGMPAFPQIYDYPLIVIGLGGTFSYLWLTSAIFSSEDWKNHRCETAYPVFRSCTMKKVVISFDFIAFFLILAHVLISGLLFAHDFYRQKKKLQEIEGKRPNQSLFVDAPVSGENGTVNGAMNGTMHTAGDDTTEYHHHSDGEYKEETFV